MANNCSNVGNFYDINVRRDLYLAVKSERTICTLHRGGKEEKKLSSLPLSQQADGRIYEINRQNSVVNFQFHTFSQEIQSG